MFVNIKYIKKINVPLEELLETVHIILYYSYSRCVPLDANMLYRVRQTIFFVAIVLSPMGAMTLTSFYGDEGTLPPRRQAAETP